MTIPRRSEELPDEQPEVRVARVTRPSTWEVREASGFLPALMHGAEQAAHWIGNQVVETGQAMEHPLREVNKSYDRWQQAQDNGTLNTPGNPSYYEEGPVGEVGHAALGYGTLGLGAWKLKKGLGNIIRKVKGSPMADDIRSMFGRGASVQIELELEQDLQKIMQMLKCLCGKECQSTFNGMPHCAPGEGCCSNWDPSNHACGSCGNPAATGDHMGMALCRPGEPGCNEEWTPGSESPQEKIQDHDHWAQSTNHGEYRMPGEPVKPLPPTHTATSSWTDTDINFKSATGFGYGQVDPTKPDGSTSGHGKSEDDDETAHAAVHTRMHHTDVGGDAAVSTVVRHHRHAGKVVLAETPSAAMMMGEMGGHGGGGGSGFGHGKMTQPFAVGLYSYPDLIEPHLENLNTEHFAPHKPSPVTPPTAPTGKPSATEETPSAVVHQFPTKVVPTTQALPRAASTLATSWELDPQM